MQDRLLLSRKEAAAMLGISVRTLDSVVVRREMSARRIGRRVLFAKREIERFAKSSISAVTDGN
jgi:excisionase family DNA binding protein